MQNSNVRRRALFVGVSSVALAVTAAALPAWAVSAQASPRSPLPIQAGLVGKSTTTPTVPGEVVVTWKAGTSAAAKTAVKADEGLTTESKIAGTASEVVSVDDGASVSAAIDALDENPRVEAVQPNYRYSVSDLPCKNSASFESCQWGLYNWGQDVPDLETGDLVKGTAGVDIGAAAAWDHPGIGGGSTTVTVGVIDTGADTTHPDLADALVPGYNALTGTTNVTGSQICASEGVREDFHGTHVSGIIAANRDGSGVTGVAYNVKVMPIKALDCEGGSTESVMGAIEFARTHGVKIVNASWGGPEYDEALDQAIRNSGMLFLVAAGNGDQAYNGPYGDDIDTHGEYPAASGAANVLSVAAVDQNGNLPYWSNFGRTRVDVGAPGSGILSDGPSINGDPQYYFADGTSMATPFVAGVAALALSQAPSLTTTQLKSKLMGSTRALPSLSGKTVTGGMIDASYLYRTGTSATMSRSTSIVKIGQYVSFSTVLKQGSSPLAGTYAKLWRQPVNGSWSQACTATTGATGYAKCSVKPTTKTAYQWRYEGNSSLRAASSTTLSVLVQPTLTIRTSATSIKQGTTLALAGTLNPGMSGAAIYIQRKVGNNWLTYSRTYAASTGSYRWTGKPRTGTYVFRAYRPADAGHRSALSSALTVRVR